MISIPESLFGDRAPTRNLMYLHPAGEIMRAMDRALDRVFPAGTEVAGIKIQPTTLCPLDEAWLFDHDGKLHRVVMEGKAK